MARTRMVMKYIGTATCLLYLSIFCMSAVYGSGADSTAKKTIAFVDLDGDGINDNLPDSNGDGIPDIAGPGQLNPDKQVTSALGDVFNSPNVANESKMEALKSCSDRYAETRFKVRGISMHRIGLIGTDPFGAGSGIGSAGAGACAGGVCH